MRYSVGDVITVRSWKSLRNEYGTYSDGRIKGPVLFNGSAMLSVCGRMFTIMQITPARRYLIYDGDSYWVLLDSFVL